MGRKKVIINQKYEKYWQLTLEYSDFLGESFNNVLRLIVTYIDSYVDKDVGITSSQYKELQTMVERLYHKEDSASTRKSINQFYKLGFINNKGKSYHSLTKKFLESIDSEEKRLIYSKILYDNASFSRSYENESNINEIKFFIKTLEECEKITKFELLALMFTDVSSITKGYLTKEEINTKLIELTINKASERKYNQQNFLFNTLKKLTDVYNKNDILSLSPLLLDEKREKLKVRDPYLQRLYKIELINEFKENYHTEIGKCVLEKLAYPILIASHIKPYIKCNDEEAFDKNNGLLLSKNMDSLFDNGYITFDNEGVIISSDKLDKEVADYVSSFRLDALTYNSIRKDYMKYHRENVFLN